MMGLLTRTYDLLDEMLSTRVRSVGEWIRKFGYTEEARPLLKDWMDAEM